MKIILNKQALKIADTLSNQLKIILKQHGIKLKEAVLMQFRYRVYISLGGKKEKYKN